MKLRRLFVAIGAPLVLIVGLGVVWGVRKGSAMVELIDAWSDSLKHSHGPVTMEVADVPLISAFHVDGDRIGKLSQVVVLRHEPGSVDSLRFVVEGADPSAVAAFDDCQLFVDPGVFERIDGPGEALRVLKRVVSCDAHNPNLVPFGTLVFAGMDREAPLYIERRHHPCLQAADSAGCDEFRTDIQVDLRHLRDLREEIRREVRSNVRQNVRVVVP